MDLHYLKHDEIDEKSESEKVMDEIEISKDEAKIEGLVAKYEIQDETSLARKDLADFKDPKNYKFMDRRCDTLGRVCCSMAVRIQGEKFSNW